MRNKMRVFFAAAHVGESSTSASEVHLSLPFCDAAYNIVIIDAVLCLLDAGF